MTKESLLAAIDELRRQVELDMPIAVNFFRGIRECGEDHGFVQFEARPTGHAVISFGSDRGAMKQEHDELMRAVNPALR